MEKVIISAFVYNKLRDLIEIMYDKEYFGFKMSAVDYVKTLMDFMYTIPDQKHRKANDTKYGPYYCRYRHNYKTTWYI